jgi:hypothetical protein
MTQNKPVPRQFPQMMQGTPMGQPTQGQMMSQAPQQPVMPASGVAAMPQTNQIPGAPPTMLRSMAKAMPGAYKGALQRKIGGV